MVRDAALKFTRESSGTLAVHSVSSDGIRINDEVWQKSIGLTPEAVLDDWQEKPVAELVVEDFEVLLALDPELVIVGTGTRIEFPPRELVFAFARKGIGLEVMDTAAAARTFNVLAGEGRRVASVLFLPD